jgi:hypothetical protein
VETANAVTPLAVARRPRIEENWIARAARQLELAGRRIVNQMLRRPQGRLTPCGGSTRFIRGRTACFFACALRSLPLRRAVFRLMKRSFRPLVSKSLAAAFTAVFGCISLFGQGLHTLVEHAHNGSAHAACRHAGHDHAGHDHGGHDHGWHVADDGGCNPTDATSFRADRSHHHDDCPICGFFAQAQHALTAFEIRDTAACLPLEPLADDVARAMHVGSYQSRGPPLS